MKRIAMIISTVALVFAFTATSVSAQNAPAKNNTKTEKVDAAKPCCAAPATTAAAPACGDKAKAACATPCTGDKAQAAAAPGCCSGAKADAKPVPAPKKK